MASTRSTPTRRRRARARAVTALLVVVAVGGAAGAAGVVLGAEDGPAAEERGTDVPGAARPLNRAGALDRSRPVERAAGRRSRGRERGTAQGPRIDWRRSQAIGLPHAGALEAGVKLPFAGRRYFTWDPIQKESPNRGWRRWGTDRLVRTTLRVVREFAAAHPGAPRVGIGDLSRPRGGDFGARYGLPGHVSHQNGLDVDLYYPRLDHRERAPLTVDQVDWTLAQDLVDRFVRAGAEKIFVGPATGLRGPPEVVAVLENHDNHLHVRIPG